MHFTEAIAHFLESLCAPEPEKKQFAKVEFQTEPYSVSLFHWVYHIYRMSKISPSGIISTCILLDRIRLAFPTLHFSNLNVRRLFLIGAMVISKVYEDVTYCNKDWVVISHNSFTLHQINQMEWELLVLLNFMVSVSLEEFTSFSHFLLRDYHVHMPISLAPLSAVHHSQRPTPQKDSVGYVEFYVPSQNKRQP
ncbi:hypothetical protein BLNAU_13728 [Blattamonas nauphoetae]|uniref:Cyclin n=1 Tax=Blattamonas nauphoetae TaxID=2049346 RepID=A0ABQ9XI15_9EUKA|nr:hypothetical protein BLNAU_13728 [Blattamonas nauphoetae]